MSLFRKIRHTAGLLRRSVINSARAFRPTAIGYHLAIGDFGGFEVVYRKATCDEEVIEQGFDNDIFFSAVPEYSPRAHDVIIDVGAHIGVFSLLAAAKVPEGRVFAIEASQDSFNLLRINVALNQLQNVKASHMALFDKKGQITLYHDIDKGDWGHSVMKRLSSDSEVVSTDTLGGYMSSEGIERCDFIKFNCEGAEFPILISTPPEVLKKIERMLILYHCDLAGRYSLETLAKHLQDGGFNLKFFNQRRYRGWLFAQRKISV